MLQNVRFGRPWANWRSLALLAVEPALVLGLLANRTTHDLIRFYPPSAAGDSTPSPRWARCSGPTSPTPAWSCGAASA